MNANGWSALSTDSTGAAVVQTVPNQMSSPVREATTTSSSLTVSWSALSLANSGYSAVTSYHL